MFLNSMNIFNQFTDDSTYNNDGAWGLCCIQYVTCITYVCELEK